MKTNVIFVPDFAAQNAEKPSALLVQMADTLAEIDATLKLFENVVATDEHGRKVAVVPLSDFELHFHTNKRIQDQMRRMAGILTVIGI